MMPLPFLELPLLLFHLGANSVVQHVWLAIPLLLLPLLRWRGKPIGWMYALVLAGFSGVALPLTPVILEVRPRAFRQLANHSTPLVEAIRAYERDRGAPPTDLRQLVPGYLGAVPGTGMAACPDYVYTRGEVARKISGCEWMLEVPCSSGILNWDVFVYFPSGEYPDRGWGGWLEPIGDWAYVHE